MLINNNYDEDVVWFFWLDLTFAFPIYLLTRAICTNLWPNPYTQLHTAHNQGWDEEEEEGGDGEDSEVGMKGGLCNCHGEYDGSTYF